MKKTSRHKIAGKAQVNLRKHQRTKLNRRERRTNKHHRLTPEPIEDKIIVTNIARHRNGIGGNGFYVVLFDWTDDEGKLRKMVATVFDMYEEDDNANTAVLDLLLLAVGDIELNNKWRGDTFDDELRTAIAEWQVEKYGSAEDDYKKYLKRKII